MTRNATLRLVSLGLGLLLLLGGVRGTDAQAAPDAAILQRVDAHYNHLISLRTQFTEHYTGLGMDRTETGVLLLKKPGRMRWDYTAPVGKVFVLDGRYAWSYTPGDEQVQQMPAKELDDLRSPLRFLLGHTQLQKELTGISVTADPAGMRIAGVPKGMEQRVKLLSLRVTADGRIESLRVESIDGSATEFVFEHAEENVALPEDAFRFVPPAGVGVVRGLPPV